MAHRLNAREVLRPGKSDSDLTSSSSDDTFDEEWKLTTHPPSSSAEEDSSTEEENDATAAFRPNAMEAFWIIASSRDDTTHAISLFYAPPTIVSSTRAEFSSNEKENDATVSLQWKSKDEDILG